MIVGQVTDQYEGVIRLSVVGPQGQREEFEAVIDTGFNAWLGLPPSLINDLELRWRRRAHAQLADGSVRLCDIFETDVLWDGQTLRIPVDSCDTTPMVGMRLLDGFELRMKVREHGDIEIHPLRG